MLGKIIMKLYQWQMKKIIKKQQKLKTTSVNKEKEAIYNYLGHLYKFVRWLNIKGLKNRKVRKNFWKAVIENQPVLENVLNHLIEQYKINPVEDEKETSILPTVKNLLKAPKMKPPKN